MILSARSGTPGRVLLAGRLTVFLDDTEIEVEGKCFEGFRINYEGQRVSVAGKTGPLLPGQRFQRGQVPQAD